METTPSVRALSVLLAMLVAVAPLAIDMYLPAMQIMAADLATPIHQVELSVSSFLIGYALGSLTGGPMSDNLGRKPAIAIGLTIFIIASALLSTVTTLNELLAWRVIQAIGGGIAVVNSSAMVRDLFEGADVARVLSMVAMVMMTAPLLAPVMGAVIVTTAGWRAIFVILTIYTVLVLALLMWRLPESRVKGAEKIPVLQAYRKVLSHRQAMGYVLAISFGFSGMFTFITSSAFLYMEYFGASEKVFPLLFGANVLVLMVVNRINVSALNRHTPHTLLKTGLTIQLTAGALLVLVAMYEPQLYLVLPLIMVFVGSLGLTAANATASTLKFFPDVSGTATAVIGVTEFLIGALMGVLWATLHDGTPGPVAWVMAGCSLAAFISLRLLASGETQTADI